MDGLLCSLQQFKLGVRGILGINPHCTPPPAISDGAQSTATASEKRKRVSL